MSRIANARLGHGSMYEDINSKPVSPDICLEYMWTESQSTKGYFFFIYIFNSKFLPLLIIFIKLKYEVLILHILNTCLK